MPAILALAALIALASSALAVEPYPDHPITLIVPYATGGSSDVLGRLLGERLSKSLGKQIVIDNRAGAGSRLGIEIAARLTGDLKAILDSHEFATRLAPLGVSASHASPAQFRALIESDTARWADIVKSVGISVP